MPRQFVAWFSFAPLGPIIKESLHLTDKDLLYGNLASVSSTLAARLVIGPLCDKYGPKTCLAGLLLLGAIPTLCSGLIRNWVDLVVIRSLVGLLGSSFVVVQVKIPCLIQPRDAPLPSRWWRL
jgi:MFS transporter, NNP family, nitrate/nitrite transporter